MLKEWSSSYQFGRKRADCREWKIDLFTIDCVLLYAWPGMGTRSGLLTEDTFSVKDQFELIPIIRAYSEISDDELIKLDHGVKKNTIQRFGAVYLGALQRWRYDKKFQEADTSETLIKLSHE